MEFLDKKELKLLDTILVKLNKLYKGCYICITGYTLNIQGLETPIGFGKVITELKDKEMELINKIFNNESNTGFIKINNIKEARADLKLLEFEITEDEKEYINTEIKELKNNIDNSDNWIEFTLSDNEEENEILINGMLNNNTTNDLKTSIGPITISKQLLPHVTIKNYKDNLFYNIYKFNDELYLLVFNFNFIHFTMYCIYYILPLNTILENNTVNQE